MADVAVLKLGGSVLNGPDSYKRAALFLRDEVARTHARLVAVVSAEFGHTDVLWREAQSVTTTWMTMRGTCCGRRANCGQSRS